MPRPDLKQLLSDISSQPKWRKTGSDNGYSAQKAVDYYDGYQIHPSVREAMRKLGMPDIVENLIKRPVNAMLGHEARNRRDWVVKPDDDESSEVAEGLNLKLNEALRLCEVGSVCSEAYASQIKTGVGWVHIRRNDDPFGQPYKAEFVHRDEIYYDMRSRRADLDDCRWLARRRFMDSDEAMAILPSKFHDLVRMLENGWQDPSRWEVADNYAEVETRLGEWNGLASGNLDALLDSQRKRVALYEVYYREFVKMAVMTFADGRTEEFSSVDQRQLLAVMAGEATVKMATVRRMRRCWYLGPHFLTDEVSPYPHRNFPYVAFFGYREDGLNVPYGVIRDMMDSQDAYNNCVLRIHHLMAQVQIIKDDQVSDMSDADLRHEAARKDGVITLKSGKRFEIVRHFQEIYKLQEIAQGHKAMIQEISGVMDAYTGKGSNQQSGVALQSLAELTAVSLADINDNYEYGRKKVAELMLAYIVHDMGDSESVVDVPDDLGQAAKTIRLNAREGGRITNAVTLARYQVTLDAVNTTAGYRQQLFTRFMEMFVSAPDDMKFDMYPHLIEMSDMPRRREMLKEVYQRRGISQDPEQQAAAQQQAQEQQAAAAGMEQQARDTEIKFKLSQIDLNQAKAAELLASIEKIQAETQICESEAKAKMVNQQRRQYAAQQLANL